MGSNCTCFRSKDKETDLTILNDGQSFFYSKYQRLIISKIILIIIK